MTQEPVGDYLDNICAQIEELESRSDDAVPADTKREDNHDGN